MNVPAIDSQLLKPGSPVASTYGHSLLEANQRAFRHINKSLERTLLRHAADKFLEVLIAFPDQELSDENLDYIFEHINTRLSSAEFSLCDMMLSRADVDALSEMTLLALLSTTYIAKAKLPSRGAFFTATKRVLISRGTPDWQKLLHGLE